MIDSELYQANDDVDTLDKAHEICRCISESCPNAIFQIFNDKGKEYSRRPINKGGLNMCRPNNIQLTAISDKELRASKNKFRVIVSIHLKVPDVMFLQIEKIPIIYCKQ